MVLEAEVTHTGGRWGGAGGSLGLGERLVRTRTSAVAGDRTARVGRTPEVRGRSLGSV